MTAVNSEECQFGQNISRRGCFYDRFQQGEISFVTLAGLEMQEIRQGCKKAGRKTPSGLNLISADSYQ